MKERDRRAVSEQRVFSSHRQTSAPITLRTYETMEHVCNATDDDPSKSGDNITLRFLSQSVGRRNDTSSPMQPHVWETMPLY